MTRRWSALAALLACGGVQAQTIDRAEALWKAHQYKEAGAAFEALVKRNDKNADYKVRYGRLLLERFNSGPGRRSVSGSAQSRGSRRSFCSAWLLVAADGFEKWRHLATSARSRSAPRGAGAAGTAGARGQQYSQSYCGSRQGAQNFAPGARRDGDPRGHRPARRQNRFSLDGRSRDRSHTTKEYSTLGYFFVLNRRYEGHRVLSQSRQVEAGSVERAFAARH